MTTDLGHTCCEAIVYRLEHKHLVEAPDIYDSKLIGFFSERAIAEKTIEDYKAVIGFREYPDDFQITEMRVNEECPRTRPCKLKTVYCLYYWQEDAEDDVDYVRLLGVFSSRRRAQNDKRQWVEKKVYERQFLFIEANDINKCEWCEGFTSWR